MPKHAKDDQAHLKATDGPGTRPPKLLFIIVAVAGVILLGAGVVLSAQLAFNPKSSVGDGLTMSVAIFNATLLITGLGLLSIALRPRESFWIFGPGTRPPRKPEKEDGGKTQKDEAAK
jgi:hypothetical protein